ncbi:MAG: NAD(P)/FAD-dependent oxidoreductase [Gammaproteobacteria bacterium]|jgi:kynurenine 3-monooxygenase|nr:NAD(P)/FAD-dependent oxidoreductase [Gammaproteobacteria bacterium]
MSQTASDHGNSFSIIGAGLAGTLLAIHMARRGYQIDIHERFPDQRIEQVPSGRSINLALAARGRKALAEAMPDAALLAIVDQFSIPMRGRMLHDEHGETTLQRYSQFDDEVIYSVHRDRLNACLLRATEQHDNIHMHFNQQLETVDFQARMAQFIDPRTQQHSSMHFHRLIGCDGAGSVLRQQMQQHAGLDVDAQMLDHGYLELTVPPAEDGSAQLELHALHIWPRGGHMLIALPNPDNTFTATLFLPHQGQPGFTELANPANMIRFLQQHFPDLYPLLTQLEIDLARPVGKLGTLYCQPWHIADRALLLGDAAHAIVPFHGQGMNTAFEDISVLMQQLDDQSDDPDWHKLFSDFSQQRKPDTDAIAAMALENYQTMRDAVRDPRFHLKKQLEWALEKRFPEHFIPRYSMVMFRHTSYARAYARGKLQDKIVETLLTAAHDDLERIDWLQAKCLLTASLPALA